MCNTLRMETDTNCDTCSVDEDGELHLCPNCLFDGADWGTE